MASAGLIFLMQAAAPTVVGPPAPPAYENAEPQGDLSELLTQGRCDANKSEDGAIVVCGSRRSQHRLPPTADQRFSSNGRAEKTLANGAVVAAEAEQRNLGAGVTVPAIMLRYKIKF